LALVESTHPCEATTRALSEYIDGGGWHDDYLRFSASGDRTIRQPSGDDRVESTQAEEGLGIIVFHCFGVFMVCRFRSRLSRQSVGHSISFIIVPGDKSFSDVI
jgi:hypothetical protein